MVNNIFYFYYINSIGGVESMFYYLAKKYKEKDIVIYYSQGDDKQIERLKQFVEVKQYKPGMKIKCKRAFFNYNVSIIDDVDAEEYCLIIHADYKALNIKPITHPKITRYIAVSQLAADSYKEVSGKECEVCYNPILIDKPKKTLKLISATRLTKEKGRDRIIKLGELLNKKKIPYEWTIFTNDTRAIKNPNIIYKKPELNIINYIAESDYLVQLSDNEAYCYSIVEALSCGVPVICTPCPVFTEIGLENGKNCYFCDFDMKNVPINDIYNKIPKFTYIPKKDNWENLLAPGPSQYLFKKEKRCIVKATDLYSKNQITDKQLNRIPKEGDKWETNLLRYELLSEKGYVTLIKEI